MWQVMGQSRAVSFLQQSLERHILAHAYLFVGPRHVGKMALALNLAQALNCEAAESPCGACISCEKIAEGRHADVQIVGLAHDGGSADVKSRAEIGIDQIREMQHSSNLPPFEGRCKVFIIDGAEFMSGEAANCLLKTLEEPADNVVYILLTADDELLPATVVSRCQRLELTAATIGEIEGTLRGRWGVDEPEARLLARLSHGCLGWALSAVSGDNRLVQRAEEIERLLTVVNADYEERFACVAQLVALFNKNRESVQEVLDLWLDWWRDLMLIAVGCGDNITNIDYEAVLDKMAGSYTLTQIKTFIEGIRAAQQQLRQNANPQLVLEVLMLSVPGRKHG